MHAFQDSTTSAADASSSRRLTVVPRGDAGGAETMVTVASYDDYRRAVAAVTELCEHGNQPRDLHLASTEFETVRVRPDSDLRHEAGRAFGPALLGAIGLAVGAAAIASVSLRGPLWVLVATTVAVAAVAAVVVAVFRARGDGLPVAKERVVPVRHEVRCRRADAAEAEHHLAGWWKKGLDGPPLSAGGRRIVGR